MKRDRADISAIHDKGAFRNSFAENQGTSTGEARLNDSVGRFGHRIRPLIDEHPISGRKFLNFNEAFVSHIVGLTTNDSNAPWVYLANHMNKPEDQIRWRWQMGDVAMWDNRVTMHYAVADYLPQYRCMNRVAVVRDKREDAPAPPLAEHLRRIGALMVANKVGKRLMRPCPQRPTVYMGPSFHKTDNRAASRGRVVKGNWPRL